jgi:hypothetical protein
VVGDVPKSTMANTDVETKQRTWVAHRYLKSTRETNRRITVESNRSRYAVAQRRAAGMPLFI